MAITSYTARPCCSALLRSYNGEDRAGVGLPNQPSALLELTDGLSIPAADITLYGVSELRPVEGTWTPRGFRGAIRIGEDAGGDRYAMSTSYWRKPNGGQVIQVQLGKWPAEAPLLGPLPRLIIEWLERGNADG